MLGPGTVDQDCDVACKITTTAGRMDERTCAVRSGPNTSCHPAICT